MHIHSLSTRTLRACLLTACAVLAPACGPWAGQWENWGNARKDTESVARHLAPAGFVYQQVQIQPHQAFSALPGQSVEIGGRQWVAGQGAQQIPDRLLTAVGSAGEVQVFRLSWDEPPYDQLYVQRGPGSYTVLR